MSDPHQRSEGAVLHDRKLAAWEYAVGERPRRIEDGCRRPHRGMLPDVDFGRAIPDPGHRPLLSRIADFLWGDLRRSAAQAGRRSRAAGSARRRFSANGSPPPILGKTRLARCDSGVDRGFDQAGRRFDKIDCARAA